ncbi:MAG: ammonium transporter [Thermoguttaceae bacterium]|jgi:Amt family ammonium transporter
MKNVRQLRLLGMICVLGAIAWLAMGTNLPAQAPSPGQPAAVAPATPAATLDKGDNAWMLTSSALVLMMTGPGLALFYCGLVRKKNVLSVMMQCVFLMCLMSVIWAIYGYSLAFGGTRPWLGNGDFLFMNGVQMVNGVAPLATGDADTIPRLTHMLFQGMFFIITPALICGAFAERMKFSAMVLFMILWGTLVYCPLCHWVWGHGILCYGSQNAAIAAGGALDFAGGTVVHISSGVSALICALLLGKRLGYKSEPMPPHNMTYTVVGATLLWVGWFGFNAGSALNASDLASSAFTATHFAAAAGGLAWAVCEWIGHGKPSVLGVCSGVVAGLVCITPASGFVQPMPALLMGVAVGVVCYLACTLLKSYFGYDDSLDAFGVHGVGGTLGAILTGVFATKAVNDMAKGNPLGLLEGGSLLKGQIVAVLASWGLAIVATFVILKLLDATIGLRVSREAEIEGLDFSQHGEEGYIFI